VAIGAADIGKGLETVWYQREGLNKAFLDLWDSSVSADDFLVLHEDESAPGTPMPYCVYEISQAIIVSRFSGGREEGFNHQRYVLDYPVQFRVHAKTVSGDSRTAKEIASDLAAKIMEAYGGHPSVLSTDPPLDTGNFLIAIYERDYGLKTGDNEHQWNVDYFWRVDVPVRSIGES